MSAAWAARAIAEADRLNGEDPRHLTLAGEERPFELAYADRIGHWIRTLLAEPSDALRFASHAQHLRRWEIPRGDFPEGRAGYHAWRRRLQDHHVTLARGVLRDSGCDAGTADRVERILRKQGLGSDPEVQAMEDALCLVTLELQADELAARLDPGKLADVLRRSVAKMSPAGRGLIGGLVLSPAATAAVANAMGPEGGTG